MKSILPDEMQGVCKIAGYRGKGKSWFVSQLENPGLTAFMDFEKKGEGINAQIKFGLYVPVTEIAAGGALGIYDVFIREIEKLPKDKFTHFIIDNSAPLELAMKAEAARNASKYAKQFGMDANNIVMNRYGGQGGVVNHLISEMICNPLWAKGVKLISVTSHIKPRWAGGVQVVNSFNIKGADRWDELSILTLIMIPGDFPPVPSALVMKEQLGQISFNDALGTFTTRRRLPMRLPRATPQAIKDYLTHPADLQIPASGEVPTEDEIKPFRERLDKEQINLMLSEIEHEKELESLIPSSSNNGSEPTPPPMPKLLKKQAALTQP